MDTDFMNFSNEEYFGTSFLDSGADDSHSYDGGNNFTTWEWVQEKEINGDVALIPVSSNFDTEISNLSTSPPSKEDFHKLLCDWQQFINVDAPVTTDDFMCNDEHTTYNDPTLENEAHKDTFDITSYINDNIPEPSIFESKNTDLFTQTPPQSIVNEKKPRIAGKRIDMKAQRYLIDDPEDDHVDVETVSENGNPPVLEAGDLDSLLEQFEASEEFHSTMHGDKTDMIKVEKVDIVEVKTEPIEQETEKSVKPTIQNIEQDKRPKNQTEAEPPSADVSKSKQILEALPQELIMRIKESGKRKPISVIPPIPNKKRCGPRMQEAGAQIARNKLLQLVSSEAVQLDHDYCSSPSPYPKNPKKDSGFESAEEDERAVLRNQPTVKNADGKLMVSLLKVNTIKTNTVNEVKQKRKLNLAEYKKRREFVVKSEDNSQNSSPLNSSPNSPAVEDEVTRRKKHEEKLLQMSIDLLNTTPAKSIKIEPPKTPALAEPKVIPPKPIPAPQPATVSVSVPNDMEVKTLLSVGTNTETIPALPLCPEPVVEEIKPLLQNPKISTNSLIASVIENIPKVKSKNKNLLEEKNKSAVSKQSEEHGENKTIVYLPKNRVRPQMHSVYVQTEPSHVEEHLKHQSRCSSSKFKNLERKSRHRRKERSSSGSSRYSSSESYTSSSSRSSSRSRSRSRSTSPWQARRKHRVDYKRMQEVEERRVIYVGRIGSSTTRDDLRRRFQSFGPITRVSVHFRDHGDNYGFVTFLNKLDAYEAVEHGNDDPFYPKYDLSFGGRREFCKTSYSDLDNMHEEVGYYHPPRDEEYTFDSLLRKAQEKLRKRKL